MESECWQQLVLQSGDRSQLAWEGGYTSVNSVATIQIVPRSRAGCFSCLFCTQLLFPPFVYACLFFSTAAKYCFSLRFQLGSGMMCSCHALCGPKRTSFPGLPLRGPAEFPFHAATGTPPFSFIQSLVCLWGKRCWPVIVTGGGLGGVKIDIF